MSFENYIPVPVEFNFTCDCGSNKIEYRKPENDGCFDDTQYKCLSCNRTWWVDGIDS